MSDLIAFSTEAAAVGQSRIRATRPGKEALVWLSPRNPRVCESLEDSSRPRLYGCCMQRGAEILPSRNPSRMPFHWSLLLSSISATARKAQVRLHGSRGTLWKRKIMLLFASFPGEKLQRVDQYCDGTPWWWLGLIQSCDPQGKSLSKTWTSASGKAFMGFRKEINLLTRRRKDLYPWCRDGIRRNYELTSE